MPPDGFATALVMFELGDRPEFRAALRAEDAAEWLDRHAGEFDPETKRLWGLASLRLRATRNRHIESRDDSWSRRCA